jgi:hypothetical protein
MTRPAGRPRPIDVVLHEAKAENPETVLRIGMVVQVAGEPVDLRQRVKRCLAGHLSDLPALSRSITGTGARSRWLVNELDLDTHVRQHRLEPGGSVDDAVQRVLRLPLPQHAPPWDLHILAGPKQDGYVLFIRAHHSILDGGGLVHVLETLFRARTSTGHGSGVVGAWTRHSASTRHLLTAGRLLARNVVKTRFWEIADRAPSSERHFRWASVPTSKLRAAAKAHGGGTNEAYLAAYARALRSWATEYLPALEDIDIHMLVPVNIRRPDEQNEPGNYTAPARIVLPGRVESVGELVREIVTATVPLKGAHVRAALRTAVDHTPRAAYSLMMRVLLTPDRAVAVASNVVIRNPLQFDGDPVVSLAPLMVSTPGYPVSAVMLSYQDESTACFVTDRVLPGLDSLHRRWQDAVDEMAGVVTR